MQCINETFFEEVFVMENEKKEVLEFSSVQALKDYLNSCENDTIVSIVIRRKEDEDEEV